MKPTKTIISACQVLRSKMRFRRAGFRLPSSGYMQDDTEEIVKATKNYMETWVIPLIDAIESGDTRLLQRICEDDRHEEIGPR